MFKGALLKGTPSRNSGFTILELLVVMVILAILVAVAIPGYSRHITKIRARTAAGDLMALATDLENSFQRTLSYPVVTTNTTAETITATIGWNPAQEDFFSYTIVSAVSGYDLTATGINAMSGCVITLDESNTRTVTAPCIISQDW